MTKLINSAVFYTAMRSGKLLGPKLEQSEVDGLNAILTACGQANWPLAFTAYALATAYHETAHTLQPITELGSTAYFMRMYDVSGSRPDTARRYGNTKIGDGPKYRGRGYVQLTWKNNYARAEHEGIPGLVTNPDLALLPANAAKIMVEGMSEGWFTGKSCKSYLPVSGSATVTQFREARRIINGTDRAELIADYAVQFQTALAAGKWT